jgi:hypothetical protein
VAGAPFIAVMLFAVVRQNFPLALAVSAAGAVFSGLQSLLRPRTYPATVDGSALVQLRGVHPDAAEELRMLNEAIRVEGEPEEGVRFLLGTNALLGLLSLYPLAGIALMLYLYRQEQPRPVPAWALAVPAGATILLLAVVGVIRFWRHRRGISTAAETAADPVKMLFAIGFAAIVTTATWVMWFEAGR